MQFLLHFAADHCYHYKNLSYANRKISYVTPYGSELCDSQLPKGWYRFVGAARTKMPTTRVPAYRCGTDWSGWLVDAHPTVEDGKVKGRSTLVIVLPVANMQSQFQFKLWILLHIPTLSTCLLLTLLWYRLNGKQKIQ